MASNKQVLINRMRDCARELSAKVEEARSCFKEWQNNQGATYTDPYYHVDENLANPARTDLDHTKAQGTAAFQALNAIANPNQMAQGSTIDDYLAALTKVK